MRFFGITLFALLATCSASAAWAQYGLYGAPNVLPVQQQNATAGYPAPLGYAAPANYPATTGYQPQAGYAATTIYPAQPAAQTAYQPYQPAARYRYPAPNCQPTAWAAPVEQPMAAPVPEPMDAPMQPPMDGAGPGPVYQPLQPANQPQPGYAPRPQGHPQMQPGYAPRPQGHAPRPQGYPPTQPGYPPMPQRQIPQQGFGAMNQVPATQDGCNPGGCNDAGCGQTPWCNPCNECLWYGSFSALVLGRSDSCRIWTSSGLGQNERDQLGNTDIPMSWKWGGEVQLGRRFCCNCTPYAVEATFWTTEAMTGLQTTSLAPERIGTPLQTDNINFVLPGPGVVIPATSIFVNAISSTVERRDEFYNFEINLLRERLAWTCDSNWEIGWSMGVRYFRFQESLAVSAVNPDVVAGGADAYFKDTVTNNLIGPQIGFDLAYNVCNNVRLFINPQVGIFGNCVDSTFQARGRQGSGAYVDGTNTIAGYPNFPIHGTNNGVSFLTQVDLGAEWQFARNWSARMGYRVVAITGVGLAENEFPQYLCDTPEMQNPQHCSSLVLHGAFLGLTYNF